MQQVNATLIERYQIEVQKDPSSKLFAPLAEAYRRMGLLKEAKELCENSLKINPDYISGIVAYGNVLLDLEELEDAKSQFLRVTNIDAQNLLALKKLALLNVQLKKHKLALENYKRLLFLNPNDKEAKKSVTKLEALLAQDMDESFFQFDPKSLFELVDDENEDLESEIKQEPTIIDGFSKMDRVLSLSDAFILRNEYDKAETTLLKAKDELGDHPEIVKRLSRVSKQQVEIELKENKNSISKQIGALEKALRRIEQNKG
ncbi:MAG: tetratricopeptide repeat protein [Bdellovibrionales bacterium]